MLRYFYLKYNKINSVLRHMYWIPSEPNKLNLLSSENITFFHSISFQFSYFLSHFSLCWPPSNKTAFSESLTNCVNTYFYTISFNKLSSNIHSSFESIFQRTLLRKSIFASSLISNPCRTLFSLQTLNTLKFCNTIVYCSVTTPNLLSYGSQTKFL